MESEVYYFWCNDGRLREFTIFMHKHGEHKSLLPNHWANALIDVGRFTMRDRTEFKEGRNQYLKAQNGCNFVHGDVVLRFLSEPLGQITRCMGLVRCGIYCNQGSQQQR